MNWSALTKKQQKMAIGTVVLAVAQIFILVHFLGGRSSEGENDQVPKQELSDLQTKLDDARQVIKRADVVQKALEETVAELEELRKHTPTISDRYAWAYEYVSRRAVQAGVELDSLEEISYMGDDEKDPAEQAYEIKISTQCGYNQLVEFLWRIEGGNPLVRVKDVNVSIFPDDLEKHRVQVVLQWPAALKIELGKG